MRTARFTVIDVKRAVQGALAAGLVTFSVTLATDGSIRLAVGEQQPTVAVTDGGDQDAEALLLAEIESLT